MEINYGAFIYKESLFTDYEMKEIESIALKALDQRSPLHETGNYSNMGWNRYGLDPESKFVQKILQAIGTDEAELIDFYYLDSGAELHPHRDLTGASLNQRIRFHVPIITNPKVLWQINGEEDLFMKPGDLWCLDTSYTHAVKNGGDETRVHIVIECEINSEIRKNIPNDLQSKLHSFFFLLHMLWSFIKSLSNLARDPRYFLTQIGMIFKFFRWRILKIGRAHPDDWQSKK